MSPKQRHKPVNTCVLAGAIGEVPQQARLFNRSIRDNIAYGRPDASDADLWQAVEAAKCLDFITRRPDGIDAEAGEDGVRLSGGERQRVSIARAILKTPQFCCLMKQLAVSTPQARLRCRKALLVLWK